MKIICHRGLWKTKKEQNSFKACAQGNDLFDGIEIDLKNQNGKIVLSHDPLNAKQSPALLELVFKTNPTAFYALNIKEDGLGPELLRLINKYKIKHYMCFDLSKPEELKYRKLKLSIFERAGDKDGFPLDSNNGMIVDIFDQKNLNWTLEQLVSTKARALFFISPELHGNTEQAMWKKLKTFEKSLKIKLYLCTDFPEKAASFFAH